MKRNCLYPVALLLVVLFLAACSAPAQPQPAAAPTEAPPTLVPPTQQPAAVFPATTTAASQPQPSAAITASPTATERVKLGDITMYYASYGKGEPLILLHGVLSNADSWANQVEPFAQQYQVITPDWRGHGRTTRGDGLVSIDQIGDDIVRLMDYLKIDKANIVGWDVGAIAGLEIARLHPERVNALVAYGGWTNPKDLQAFMLSWLKDATLADLKADMDYDPDKIAPTPESLPVMLEEVRKLALTQPNITAAQLASIKPRTLLLNGVGDENLTRQSVQAMADAMPQAKFVLIPGVGHYAPKQTPDAFNKTVLDFLKGK